MAATSERNLALGVVGFDGRMFLHAAIVLDEPRGDAVGQVDRDVIELSGSQMAIQTKTLRSATVSRLSAK